MKITVIILFILMIILISYSEFTKDEINYTILGDKSSFSNTLKSINYSELIKNNLDSKDKLGFYSKDFIYEDIRITDLINKIDNNENKNKLVIQNIINKSNVILISIGTNEISYKLSNIEKIELNDFKIYNYLDEIIEDIKILTLKIKNITNSKIVFLGYYNNTGNNYNDKYYNYINEKLKYDNDYLYIDLYNLMRKNADYLIFDNEIYLSDQGNRAVYNKIMSKINSIYLQN